MTSRELSALKLVYRFILKAIMNSDSVLVSMPCAYRCLFANPVHLWTIPRRKLASALDLAASSPSSPSFVNNADSTMTSSSCLPSFDIFGRPNPSSAAVVCRGKVVRHDDGGPIPFKRGRRARWARRARFQVFSFEVLVN